MTDITEPLILSRGSHRPGTGRGCALNVISWEEGAPGRTSHPHSIHPRLHEVIWRTNDSLAIDWDGVSHTGPEPLGGEPVAITTVLPQFSADVLDLAHYATGTGEARVAADAGGPNAFERAYTRWSEFTAEYWQKSARLGAHYNAVLGGGWDRSMMLSDSALESLRAQIIEAAPKMIQLARGVVRVFRETYMPVGGDRPAMPNAVEEALSKMYEVHA